MIPAKYDIVDGNRLSNRGISYGYGDSNPDLIKQGKHYAVVRQRGVQDFESRSQSGYYPAEWFLVKYHMEGEKFVITKVVEQAEPGRKWHACKKAMIKKMEELDESK